MRTDLKKLALQAFTNNRIDSVTFYVRNKPAASAHILLRLQYKNDKMYRIYLRYKNGYSYSHQFQHADDLMRTIGFITLLDDMRGEIISEAKGNMAPVPKDWIDMEAVEFNRRAMQKLLHLR